MSSFFTKQDKETHSSSSTPNMFVRLRLFILLLPLPSSLKLTYLPLLMTKIVTCWPGLRDQEEGVKVMVKTWTKAVVKV